jgi:myo-inositol-1(or 4)-monophosphatase
LIHNHEHIELVRNAFLESAKIIQKSNVSTTGFIEREIKLSTDTELDVFFRKYLETHTDIAVYSEESLGGNSPLKGKSWIVDPLDGSLNFYRNIPFYSSSIALWEDGVPLFGCIYDYVHNEFYCGEIGVGSSLNGKPIKVSSTKATEGIKACGIPSHTKVSDSLKMFEESLNHYKKLRWLGCASLSLAYVADGRVDAYEEKGIKLWDVAAGIALVMASGGSATWNFNSDGSLNLVADNRVEKK